MVIYNPRFTRPDDRAASPMVMPQRSVAPNPRFVAAALAAQAMTHQAQQNPARFIPPPPPPVYAVRGDPSGRPMTPSRPVAGAQAVSAAPFDPLQLPIGTVPDVFGLSPYQPVTSGPMPPISVPGLNTTPPAPVAPMTRERTSGGIAERQREIERAPIRTEPLPPDPGQVAQDAVVAQSEAANNGDLPLTVEDGWVVGITLRDGTVLSVPSGVMPEGQPVTSVEWLNAEMDRADQAVGSAAAEANGNPTPEAQQALSAAQQRRESLNQIYGTLYPGPANSTFSSTFGGLANAAMSVYQVGVNAVHTNMGEAMYRVSSGDDRTGMVQALDNIPFAFDALAAFELAPDDLDRFARENGPQIRSVYENGYDSDGDGDADYPPGARAVWEFFASTLDRGQRMVADTAYDPTAPLDLIAMGGTGARAATEAAGVAGDLGPVVRGAGRVVEGVLRAPQQVFDRPIEEVFGLAGRGIKAAGGPLFRATRRSQAERLVREVGDTASGVVSQEPRPTVIDPLSGVPVPADGAPTPARPTPQATSPVVAQPPTPTVIDPAEVIAPPPTTPVRAPLTERQRADQQVRVLVGRGETPTAYDITRGGRDISWREAQAAVDRWTRGTPPPPATDEAMATIPVDADFGRVAPGTQPLRGEPIPPRSWADLVRREQERQPTSIPREAPTPAVIDPARVISPPGFPPAVLDQATVAQRLVDQTGHTYVSPGGSVLTPEPLPDGGVRVIVRDPQGNQIGQPIDYLDPDQAATRIVDMAGPGAEVVPPASAVPDAVPSPATAAPTEPVPVQEAPHPGPEVAPEPIPRRPGEAPPARHIPREEGTPFTGPTTQPTTILRERAEFDWRTTPPTVMGQRNKTPIPLRPGLADGSGNQALRRIRAVPGAWERVTADVGDEAEALDTLMASDRAWFQRRKAAKTGSAFTEERPVAPIDLGLAEMRFRANLDDAIRRTAPDKVEPPKLLRQEGSGRSYDAEVRDIERVTVDSWTATGGKGRARQRFHRDGTFNEAGLGNRTATPDRPKMVNRDALMANPDGARRYIEAVDLHARFHPEDRADPAFADDIQDANLLRTALQEAGEPVPETRVVGQQIDPTDPMLDTGAVPAAVPDVVPPPSIDRPLPPIKSSMQGGNRADEFGPLYREAGLDEINGWLDGDRANVSAGTGGHYFSTSPDLALGQTRNASGVMIEINPAALRTEYDTVPKVQFGRNKPGWEFQHAQGNAEIVVESSHLRHGKYDPRDAVVSLTVQPKTVGSGGARGRLRSQLRQLEVKGWEVTINADGSRMYRRPDVAAEATPPSPDITPAAEPDVTRLTDAEIESLLAPTPAELGGTPTPAQGVEPAGEVPTPAPQPQPRDLEVIGGRGEFYVTTQPVTPGEPGEWVAGPFPTKQQADADLAARQPAPPAAATIPTAAAPAAPTGTPAAAPVTPTPVAQNGRTAAAPPQFGVVNPIGAANPTWRERVISQSAYRTFSRQLANGELAGTWLDQEITKRVARGMSEDLALDHSLRLLLSDELAASGVRKGSGLHTNMLRLWDRFVKFLKPFDTASQVAREMQLYNPATGLRFVFTNFISNPVTIWLAKHPEAAFRAATPETLQRVLRSAIPAELPTTREATEAIVKTLKLGRIPAEVTTAVRETAEQTGELATRRVLKKVHLDSLTNLFAIKWFRDGAQRVDESSRVVVYYEMLTSALPTEADTFAGSVVQRAEGLGLNATRARSIVDELGPVIDPDVLRRRMAVYAKGSLDPKSAGTFADDVMAEWLDRSRRISDTAIDEVNRVLFSPDTTNADEILRRLTFFHFWSARASTLYIKELLQQPVMMNALLNMHQGLDHYADEQGWTGWRRGMVDLFGTPFGFTFLFNLEALLPFANLFGDNANMPFGLNPIIDTVLYLVGALRPQGDRVPSIPGLSAESRALNSLWNWVGSKVNDTGKIAFDPLPNLLQGLRETGTRLNPFTDTDIAGGANATQETTFNALVAQEASDRGYTPEQTAAAMNNPADPAYQAARDNFANQQAAVVTYRGLGGAIPVTTQGVARTTLMATNPDNPNGAVMPTPTGIGATTVPQLPGGDPYADGKITPEEQVWLDQYAAQTGTTLKPGDYDRIVGRADETYAQVNQTEEGRALIAEVDGADAVGTQAGRDAVNTWNDIVYGGLPATRQNGLLVASVEIGGHTYLAGDLDRLRANGGFDMEGLANEWAQERGLDDDVTRQQTLEQAYRAAHPAYDEYKKWQKKVYGPDGGPGPVGWWENEAINNPAAAAYLDDQRNTDPPPTESQLIGRLTSPDAYLAAQGIEGNVYQDALPPAGPGQSAPATGNQYAQKPEDPATQITQEVAMYRAEVSAVSTVLIASGISPWVFEAGSDEEQAHARQVLARYNLSVPTLSGDARAYIRWAADRQGSGQDTSIEAFLQWQMSADAMAAAGTAPYYLDALNGGGNPLAPFTSGAMGPYGYEFFPGMGGPMIEGDSYGYGAAGGAPNIGTRLARPHFSAGPSLGAMGGLLGTRIPR